MAPRHMSRRLLAVAAALIGLAGGYAIGQEPGHQPAFTTAVVAPTVTVEKASLPYPDPEPLRAGASFGPQPGVHGSNGRLSPRDLAAVYQGRLSKPSAAAWNTANLAFYAQTGRLIVLNGSGASYRLLGRPGDYNQGASHGVFTQWYAYEYWCGQGACYNAARPSTSNHGWARAGDSWTHCTDDRRRMDAVMNRVGIYWGEAQSECWHMTVHIDRFGRPDPGPNAVSPRLCLRSGGYGQDRYVRYLQRYLRRHGYAPPISGTLDRRTRHDLVLFQQRVHIHQRGCTTPATWSHLRARRR
jgi:hypothetical protein